MKCANCDKNALFYVKNKATAPVAYCRGHLPKHVDAITERIDRASAVMTAWEADPVEETPAPKAPKKSKKKAAEAPVTEEAVEEVAPPTEETPVVDEAPVVDEVAPSESV